MTEILVSVAIIAVLIALLAVAVVQVQETAKSGQCIAQLRELARTAAQYMADHNGIMPPLRSEPEGYWYDQLYVYVGRPAGRAGRFGAGQREGNPWWCPSVPSTPNPGGLRHTYAINLICGYSETPGAPCRVRMGQRYLRKTGRVEALEGNLASTAWFADGNGLYFWPGGLGTDNSLRWVHRGRANVVFMDGHATSLSDAGFDKRPAMLREAKWVEFFGQTP